MGCTDNVCGTGGWTGPLPGDPDNSSILSATTNFGGVAVSWTYPNVNPEAVAHILLFRATSPDFSTAVHKAVVTGSSYFDRISALDEQVYFYWIQIVSVYGTVGAPIGPASAKATPAFQEVLDGLLGSINASHLAQDLRTGIESIALLNRDLAKEILDRIAGNEAMAAALTAVQSETGEALTFINQEITNRTEADSALVSAVDTLAAGLAGNAAAIDEEKTVRATEIEALSQHVLELFATFGGADGTENNAAVVAEQNARVTADTALANSITALASTVGNNTAAIQAEATARSTADTANASNIVNLSARLNAGGDVAQSIAAVSQSVTNVQISLSGKASAATVDTLATTVSGHTTAIRQTVQSINGISGEYTLKIDNNGYIAGIGLINEPDSNGEPDSAFLIRADRFAMIMPGYGEYIPFAIGPYGPSTSATLQSGTGVNLLFNAGLNLTNEGWNGYPGTIGRNHSGYNIAQGGSRYGTFYINEVGNQGGGAMFIDNPFRIPVEPGTRYEVSCYTGAHRCRVAIDIDFYTWDGAYLGGGLDRSISSNGAENDEQAHGGVSLSSYKRIGMFARAPAGAASARIIIWKNATKAGQYDSWLFATMPFFGRATEGQIGLSPWSEGASALNTKITANNIATFMDNAVINNAQIGEAAIRYANILNGEVGTLKIAGEAVIVPRFAESSSSGTYPENSWQTVLTLSPMNTDGQPIVLMCGASSHTTHRLLKNGNPVLNLDPMFSSSAFMSGDGQVGNTLTPLPIERVPRVFYDQYPGSNVVYSLESYMGNNSLGTTVSYSAYRFILGLGVKR